MKRVWLWALAIFAALFLALMWFVVREFVDSSVSVAGVPVGANAATSEQIARGEYLARIGNCADCHTARGGALYAGGRAVETPFGSVFAGNLTPNKATGIGEWDSDDFYNAMHRGRSRDGRMLTPAFPFAYFTLTTREDSNALYAYLMTRVQPITRANTPHDLRFPFNTQLAIAAWRALYFKQQTFVADKAQSVEWNRGAYLTRGLAHCGACHGTRNALGGAVAGHTFDGAMMPSGEWYAPSLTDADEASVADWDAAQIARWLKDGSSSRGAALGPMADVVFRSTQYLSDDDARAMGVFLQSLPLTVAAKSRAPIAAGSAALPDERGGKIYREHCADCHGDRGEGKPDAFPDLANNRAVTMNNVTNLISIVLAGGFAPATTGNPRPHSMPPYYHLLSDADIAHVLSFIRASWGNHAPAVTGLDLVKYRNARAELRSH